MREKYESLPLVQLKELAKVRGLKGTSTMKKAELVEAMLAEDERLKKEEEAKAAEQRQESATETVRSEEPQKQERSERPVRQERNYRPDRNYRGESAENVGVRSEAYTKERISIPIMWHMMRVSIPRNWTAVSKPAVFWKSCRMAMDLSVARLYAR